MLLLIKRLWRFLDSEAGDLLRIGGAGPGAGSCRAIRRNPREGGYGNGWQKHVERLKDVNTHLWEFIPAPLLNQAQMGQIPGLPAR